MDLSSFLFSFSFFSFFSHLAAVSGFSSYCLFCITHRIECHLSSQSWGSENWIELCELPGQRLFAPPPLPQPFTSLIFICAHFLPWPWMELSSCSVQLYVYWIYSIVSHCACVSIQETASAFLEEQSLSAQALKREINQLVSSDWFWGGGKKRII